MIVGAGGDIVFFNEACERLFGYGAAEVLGRPAAMVMAPPEPCRADLAACLAGCPEGADITLRRRDGREFGADVTATTAQTPSGPHHLVIVRARADIGASASTRRSGAADDVQITGAFAHALNQPLTAAILYLQAIEKAYARETAGRSLPQPVAAILAKAIHEAERASGMLQTTRATSLPPEDAVDVDQAGILPPIALNQPMVGAIVKKT